MKTLRNPQSYSEQTTGPRKRNGISIFALDPRFLIQHKLVTLSQRKRLAEISALRTSATSHEVFILLPALVLSRKRRCPVVLDVRPVCSFETNSSSATWGSPPVDTQYALTWEAHCQPRQNRQMPANSFPPRVLSFRSVTELMAVMGSSPQSRPNRSLSASLDGSVPTSSTSWQSSADGQSLAGWPFPPHLYSK